MIIIDSVSKAFDVVKSLRNVSFVVENGSIFGLIGSNGSGKSTLLRIMCGIYRADEGDIIYDSKKVWEESDIKKQFVYLSDDQYFMHNASTADMAKMYASVYPTFSMEKYREYLSIFGLDEKRKISTFSKGMQKQASIILGLACCTDYLFCDETLDGLDPVMRQTVRRIIAAEVAERGVSVVFASHNLRELEDICDHVALLHKGELLFEAGLDDMKLGIHKVQMTIPRERLEEANKKLDELNLLSKDQRGSLFTVVAKGSENEISSFLATLEPTFVEFIPLTLEEVFIAEMEERGYEFHESFIG